MFNIISVNGLVAALMVLIIESYFIVSFLTKHFNNTDHGKLGPIHYAALGGFISTAFWGLNAAFMCIFGDPKFIHVQIFFFLWLLSTILATMFMYVFMICRVYFAFKESVYEITKKMLKCHISLIILYPLLLFVALLLKAELYRAVALILLCFVMICGAFHLTYKFVNNLFHLILSQRQTIINIDNDDSNTTTLTLNERQLRLLKTVTTHTLLAIWMGFIYILCKMCLSIFIGLHIENNVAIIIATIWIFAIEYIVMTLCIYLGFGFNEKHYNLCCAVCHNKLGKMCESIAETHINKRAYEDVNKLTKQKSDQLTKQSVL